MAGEHEVYGGLKNRKSVNPVISGRNGSRRVRFPATPFYFNTRLPWVQGRKKKMNLMQIISYIEENHLEHDFNKFRNFRYFSNKEPIEVTLIAFYQERAKGEKQNEN